MFKKKSKAFTFWKAATSQKVFFRSPLSQVPDMTSLVLLVVLWTNFYILPKKVNTLQCYECSDFPREPHSQDEPLGPCPGWQRKAIYYGLNSFYDACMTVKLKVNGTVISQNAVIYSQCLEYKVSKLKHENVVLI